MNGFHPRATHAPAATAGPDFLPGVPVKLVIHTIEDDPGKLYRFNPGDYFGHQGWPHATIDSRGIHQHYPIDTGARTLENRRGGVETNAAHAIQCEVMGRAEFVDDLPDSTIGHLADWLTWCAEQSGAPLTFADFRPHPASAGVNAQQRFTGQEWMDFTGICGHQHVPENDHGDPGDLPVDRLRNHMEEEVMSPELTSQLQLLLATTQATNAALARVETSVRDENFGLGRQIAILRQEVAAIK